MSSQTTRRTLPKPRRTLAIFFACVLGLVGILVGIDVSAKPGADNVWVPQLGLDLEGGTRITLQATTEKGNTPEPDKLAEARSIIEQRVNATGVTEAEVSTQGNDQIIIEIPGQSEQAIADQVGRTAQLRFRLLWASLGSSTKPISAAKSAELDKTVAKADWSKLTLDELVRAETEGLQILADKPKEYTAALNALAEQAKGFACTKKSLPNNDRADLPLVTCDPKTGEVMILSPMIIPGTDVKSATPTVPQNSVEWVVSIQLKGEGRKAFDKASAALYAQTQAGQEQKSRFAIVLDGEVLSAPTMQAHISDGASQIQGDFTAESARALSNQLKYGALPLTFELNNSSFEGPTLAGNQLQAGLYAGLLGLLLTILYLFFYYRGLGLLAVASTLVAIGLTYVMVLLLGAGLDFTLTLPGLAGFIIAIGISIDSFIIYFERIRDEMREGKSIRIAVETGWTITNRTKLAANAVTIMAALLIYIFAIGVVKGFAFALGLSTIIDLVVIFFFTKPVMTLLARTKFYGRGHRLSGLDARHLGITGRDVSIVGGGPRSSGALSTEGEGV
ncbi:MAG TPA: protein translocase subunit SecD [Aeromicrobium sp.]|nr:protein translocase subunit SecD [Aeromicrobium sp.]HKY59170.1 protein translocase subunit SecD [Aeromicrobium sp.]